MRAELVTVALVLGGCAANPRAPVLYEHSTLDALAAGAYDGDLTVRDLRARGDFGLGAHDKLGGELVALTGVVYRIDVAGRATIADDDARVPYATVTFFRPTIHRSFTETMSRESLERLLDVELAGSRPLAIRISGRFRRLTARSIAPQAKPYSPLAEVVKHESRLAFEHVSGVLVGYRLPAWMRGLNIVGYHFHFIDDARTRGGHVLDFVVEGAVVDAAALGEVVVHLPIDRPVRTPH